MSPGLFLALIGALGALIVARGIYLARQLLAEIRDTRT